MTNRQYSAGYKRFLCDRFELRNREVNVKWQGKKMLVWASGIDQVKLREAYLVYEAKVETEMRFGR